MADLKPNDILAGKYRLLQELGAGGFAQVWKAQNLDAGITQAVKVYAGVDGLGEEVFRREFAKFHTYRHPNILNASDYGKHEGRPFLVMEYCPNGAALDRLGGFSEPELWQLVRDLAAGLHYLHERRVVHKDIKPDNFLINAERRFLLSDLGISDEAGEVLRKSVVFTGGKEPTDELGNPRLIGKTPPPYRAPELFATAERPASGESFATDIWALGASVFQLATGRRPFDNTGGLTQTVRPEVPRLPERFSRQLDELTQQCMNARPSARPSAAQLLRMAEKGPAQSRPGAEMATEMETVRETYATPRQERVKPNRQAPPTPPKKKWPLPMAIALAIVAIALVFFFNRNEGSPGPVDDGATPTTEEPVAATPEIGEAGATEEERELMAAINRIGDRRTKDEERIGMIPSTLGDYFSPNAVVRQRGKNNTIVESMTAEDFLGRLAVSSTIDTVLLVKARMEGDRFSELTVEERHKLTIN